jgi:hypothetical protein
MWSNHRNYKFSTAIHMQKVFYWELRFHTITGENKVALLYILAKVHLFLVILVNTSHREIKMLQKCTVVAN